MYFELIWLILAIGMPLTVLMLLIFGKKHQNNIKLCKEEHKFEFLDYFYIRKFTIDNDTVDVTNINRQLIADTETIGMAKV